MFKTLIAKPVVNNEFWIVTDGKEKVGNIMASGTEFEVRLHGEKTHFKTTKSIQKLANIEFQKSRPSATREKHLPFAAYPTCSTAYNSILDIKRRLHLYTTSEKSKCYHAAGWFAVQQGAEYETIFCPKYIFIQRYSYKGPFKTETEAKNMINT
jgi:hypothetical protein